MNRHRFAPPRLVVAAVLAAALTLGRGTAYANPETAVDFSLSTAFIAITSNSSTSPNILGTATATCPETGFLVAMGTIGFQPLSPPSGFTTANVVYGISKNAVAMDPSNSYEINQFTGVSNNVSTPASIMRVDSCNGGQSVTYRLAAHRIGGASATASEPKLVVLFVKDRM